MGFVYLSGPITDPDRRIEQGNVRKASHVWNHLRKVRIPAICPHWSWYAAHDDKTTATIAHDEWIETNKPVIEQATAILMLDGWAQSKGSVAECQHAMKNGIPVFYDITLFKDWWQRRMILDATITDDADDDGPTEIVNEELNWKKMILEEATHCIKRIQARVDMREYVP